jgi:hypothetical protein
MAIDRPGETEQPEPMPRTPEEQEWEDTLRRFEDNSSYPPEEEPPGQLIEMGMGESADGPVPRRHEKGRSGQARRQYYERAPGDLAEPESSRPETPTDRAIAESLSESVKETSEWAVETAVKIGAHCINPVLGHMVTIAFEVKEVLGDVEALASPDSDRELHVPLAHITPDIEIDLDVHLHGQDGAGEGAPYLTAFIAPGSGSLFGGWAIENASDEDAEQDTHPSNREVPEQTSEVISAPPVAPDLYGLISCDLSKSLPAVDQAHRAAILGDAAPRMLPRLQADPEFADKPMIVVYDEQAGLGTWMIQPELYGIVAGRQIEIERDTKTGLMTVLIA